MDQKSISMSEHHRKLERMYLAAKVNSELYGTTTCSISDEEAEIGLAVSEKYHHALGAMHGSVYFKLLDDAAFFAVNSIVRDVFVLTTSFHIHFLRPVSDGRIRAIGRVRFKSGNLFVADAVLYSSAGKEIAMGTGSFVRSSSQLKPDIGYL